VKITPVKEKFTAIRYAKRSSYWAADQSLIAAARCRAFS